MSSSKIACTCEKPLRDSDRVDAGDVADAFDLRADDPVLHGAQVGGALDIGRETLALRREVRAVALPARFAALCRGRARAAGVLVLDGPHVDLAQPR